MQEFFLHRLSWYMLSIALRRSFLGCLVLLGVFGIEGEDGMAEHAAVCFADHLGFFPAFRAFDRDRAR
jgi:hypothetical protein